MAAYQAGPGTRWAILAGLTLALPGCVPDTPPVVATVAPDPADSCGPQVVVFVSAGDLFRSPPRRSGPHRSGPASAAELTSELARENAALERLQIAFDALLYCRWTEVRVIRAEAATGGTARAEAPARLAVAAGRLRRDLTRAEQIKSQLGDRAARLEAAVEQAAPGTQAAVLGERAAREAPSRAVASAPVVLRLRPDPNAPEIARVTAGTEVSLRPASTGFGFVDAGPRAQGYAQAAAFTILPQRRVAVPFTAGAEGELRRLVASNVAKRDNFQESLEVAARAAEAGFTPAS